MTDTIHTDSVESLAKELRMVANMINMGEKIQWGHETTLMDKAADMLTTLHTPKDTNSPDSISTEKDVYQHTDRSNLGQIEKKFDLLSTETQQTDSVETTIEEVAQTIKIIACKAGSHGRTWKEADKMIRYELSKLVQAHTSQQVDESDLAQHLKANFCDGEDDNTAVRFTYAGALEIAEYFFRLGKEQQVEEAVLQADATGAYHSGYLAGKAEVEEAVRNCTCGAVRDTIS